MNNNSPEITALLIRWGDGDASALQALIPAVYEALSAMARRHLRHERRGVMLDTGELVHEAYMKLVDQSRVEWRNRNHFYAIAAQTMRRLLVEDARRRRAAKRGGALSVVPLDESVHGLPDEAVDVLALNDALDELARVDPEKSRLVELRFFGGLSNEELAEVLNVSVSTIEREWRVARAWLFRYVSCKQS